MNEALQTLPDGWRLERLEDICDPVEKVNPRSTPTVKFDYLDIASIDNSQLKITSPKRYKGEDAPSRARQKVKAGDTLFSTVRTYLKNIALVPPIYEGQIASTGFCVIRPGKRIDSKYLFYFVTTEIFLNPLNELQRGTSYPAVRDSDVFIQNIPLPPLDEQQRIVARIEELFTQLDAGVAALETVRAQVKRYRKSVIDAGVRGRLTSDWRKAKLLGEEQNLGDSNINRIDITSSRIERLKEIPGEWIITSIESVAQSLDYKRVPINKEERAKREGNIPYYGANGQVGWINDYIFDEPLILVVEDETFTGREKPFSYKITGKTWVNNHAHVLKAKGNILTDYLNYSLSFYPFVLLTTGTTGRKKLTKSALMEALIELPSIEEQSLIISEIERRLSIADQIEKSIDQSLQQAARLRQSILQRAFTGKL